MKTVILAGGRGTRLSEETSLRPKPMVEIGGKPMLWHLMSLYATHGFRDFVIACGYKGEMIKQYISDMAHHTSDWSLDLRTGERTTVSERVPDWRVSCIDTGAETQTGGRLKHLQPMLGDGTFMVTYGDGLSDVPVADLVAFHRSHGKLATVTAVHPPARFGALELDADRVTVFSEKPQTKVGWINGGFFVFEPRVLDYIEGPDSSLERDALERIAEEGQLMAYKHDGFFQPMDTLREKHLLEEMWRSGTAPWVARA